MKHGGAGAVHANTRISPGTVPGNVGIVAVGASEPAHLADRCVGGDGRHGGDGDGRHEGAREHQAIACGPCWVACVLRVLHLL